MKLFLLLTAFFVYVQCRPELPPTDVMKQAYNDLMLKALKKKYGASYTGSPDDACSQACIKPPPPGFGKYLVKIQGPKDPDSIKDTVKEFFSKEFLSKVCAFANETAACVKACPDTQRRAFLRELFAPIKYVCVDSHMVQNADCLRDALAESGPRCYAGECAPKFQAAQQSFATYQAAVGALSGPEDAVSTKSQGEDLLAKSCDVVRCGVNCGDATRIQKCGAEANQEVHNFYKELAKSLDAARYLSPRNYVIDIPQQCKVQ